VDLRIWWRDDQKDTTDANCRKHHGVEKGLVGQKHEKTPDGIAGLIDNDPNVSVLQCVVVCCSVLQCVAVRCNVFQCAAMCCSVLQCAAVCCSVWQRVAACCSVLQCVAVRGSVWQCAAVCGSVLPYVAVLYSVLPDGIALLAHMLQQSVYYSIYYIT